MSNTTPIPHKQINAEGVLTLKRVRLSFPHLFQARGYQGDESNPKFSAGLMIANADKENLDALKIAIQNAKAEKWPGGVPKLGEDRSCVKSGDDSADERKHGHMILTANSTRRPAVYRRDKSVATESDNVIYGGVYADVKVVIWAMDNKFGKRICCDLKAVRSHEDGDTFGTSVQVKADDFDDLQDPDSDPFG